MNHVAILSNKNTNYMHLHYAYFPYIFEPKIDYVLELIS